MWIAIAITCSCDSGQRDPPATSGCEVSMFYAATTMTATIAAPACADNANADVFIFDRASGDGVGTSTTADGATSLTFKGNIGDDVVVTLSTDDQSVSACFVLVNGLVASNICAR